MICTKCGNTIPNGAKYCSHCGTEQPKSSEPGMPVFEAFEPETQYQPAQTTMNSPETNAREIIVAPPTAKQTMIWAILGAAFGCTFFTSFLGIIFSVKTKRLVKSYKEYWGTPHGMAKAGDIISRIGLPVSIVMTSLFVVYMITAIFAAALN